MFVRWHVDEATQAGIGDACSERERPDALVSTTLPFVSSEVEKPCVALE